MTELSKSCLTDHMVVLRIVQSNITVYWHVPSRLFYWEIWTLVIAHIDVCHHDFEWGCVEDNVFEIHLWLTQVIVCWTYFNYFEIIILLSAQYSRNVIVVKHFLTSISQRQQKCNKNNRFGSLQELSVCIISTYDMFIL